MIAWLVLVASLTVTTPPPGTAGVLVASDPDQRILVWKSAAAVTEGRSMLRAKVDLERFKDFIEGRGTETGAWRGTVEQSAE